MLKQEVSTEEIIQTLANMVAKKKGIDIATIKVNSTLESLELDSLDVFDLIFSAEHKYHIRFPKHVDASMLINLNDVAEYTQKLIIEKNSAS
ncbi:MAG: acyl carrier protein [Methylophilaceae bacterium]